MSGEVSVLVERRKQPHLVEAARVLSVGKEPSPSLTSYVEAIRDVPFRIDHNFGAVPIGRGGGARDIRLTELLPEQSDRFLVRAFIKLKPGDRLPETIDGELVHADPPIGSMRTCANSRYYGTAEDVSRLLRVSDLKRRGLDGHRVALAIVDTGISLKRLTRRLGELVPGVAPRVDVQNSWQLADIAGRPFRYRVGHGTMCAADALIAAPQATLLDIPMLLDRYAGDHRVMPTISAAIRAYYWLLTKWREWRAMGPSRPYDALVVNNSWGIFHPCLEQPIGLRYIDNPTHPFRLYSVQPLLNENVDIVFASHNCGHDCASAVCLGDTGGMIMGANAYEEVLTVGGCDIDNTRVGYSSLGPSIAGMDQKKPDLLSYTHFLGSKAFNTFTPDSGVSAACAVASGCLAALRSGIPATITPRRLADAFRNTAQKGMMSPTPGGQWNPQYGCGIINPVGAARSLGLNV